MRRLQASLFLCCKHHLVEIAPFLPSTFLIYSFRAIAPRILHSFHTAGYDPAGQCIACRVPRSPWADTICICPQTGTSVATQCSAWVNEAFSEAGYLAQIKYHVILLFNIQVITLRWNCITMCKSISLARGRQRPSPLYFILLGRQTCHQSPLMGSLFPQATISSSLCLL